MFIDRFLASTLSYGIETRTRKALVDAEKMSPRLSRWIETRRILDFSTSICIRQKILNSFIKYAEVPIVNLESSTAHPLQALADAITIREHKKNVKPKIVLSWAPHPNPLPHAVANSFVKMVKRIDAEFVITNPVGYNLNSKITDGVTVTHDQNQAFKNADFIYAKNWSSYDEYGQVITKDKNWMIDNDLMSKTNDAYFMHCLPVRRNIVVADDVLDSGKSIVIKQAQNRIYSSLVVLKRILENEK